MQLINCTRHIQSESDHPNASDFVLIVISVNAPAERKTSELSSQRVYINIRMNSETLGGCLANSSRNLVLSETARKQERFNLDFKGNKLVQDALVTLLTTLPFAYRWLMGRLFLHSVHT